MNRFENCPICNSVKLKELVGFEKDFISQCSDCGFVFAYKIPTHAELLDEYSKYPRTNLISEITVQRYKSLLIQLEPYRSTNNILDVGAGDGHFIYEAKQCGWNAYATEFDDKSVALCNQKGVITHQGKLDPSNYGDIKFDIIISSEVIEHINNEVEEVQNFFKLLRPGGIVYVTTPNFNSVSKKLLGSKWSVFSYPEHLAYYTPHTLKKLFRNSGFKTLSVKTTGISPSRLYAKENEGYDGTRDEELRIKTESSFIWNTAKKLANGFLNFSKSGDTITCLFQKI